MKKLIAVLLVILICVPALASCNLDFSATFEQLSEQIFSQAVDLAGGFLKEDTTPKQSYDYGSELLPSDTETEVETETETESETQSTPVETEPETPDEPPIPEEPELPSLEAYVRDDYPLNKFMGLNINTENHREKYIMGFARFLRTLDTYIDDSEGYGYLAISGIEPSVFLDFDLSEVGSTITKEELREGLCEFANIYCIEGATFNVRRIEIGSRPEEKISAESYAELLNFIYDGNQNELEDGLGVAYVNPKVRLIAGAMASPNLDYIQALMTAAQGLRNDGFLPIGGWAFDYKTGLAPESCLNDASLKDVIEYRDTYYENLEIFISAFGWDTVNTESELYVAPTATFTSEEVQAAYILRALMLYDKMGIDRASLGTLKDTDTDGTGVIRKDGYYKTAYGVLESFKTTMKNMYFKEAKAVTGGTYQYIYEDKDGNQVHAIWNIFGDRSYTTPTSLDGFSNGKISSYNPTTGKYESSAMPIGGDITINDMPIFITFTK